MAKSKSVGTKFNIDDKAVGGLSSIGGVEVSSETTEVTALDNTTGYKEYLGGFKDGGEVPLEGFLDGDDQGQDAMYAAMEDQEEHSFSVVFRRQLERPGLSRVSLPSLPPAQLWAMLLSTLHL